MSVDIKITNPLIAIQDIMINDDIRALLKLSYGFDPFIYTGHFRQTDANKYFHSTFDRSVGVQAFALFGSCQNLQSGFDMLRSRGATFGYLDDYEYNHLQLKFGDKMLNYEAMFMPWKVFKHNLDSIFDTLGPRIWIRSKSGMKTLTGQILTRENKIPELNTIDKYSSIMEESFVCFTREKELDPIEWRFWIIDSQIVAYSPYSWNSDVAGKNVPEPILNMVNDWLRDEREDGYTEDYVLDCVMYAGTPKILEMNSIHSSGFYQANVLDIVEAVLRKSYKERN